jgi:glycosyltransferase involved in cell wall biosynthesis
MKKNLAIITTHPIQYQIPLFKELSKRRKFKTHVFYANDLGINKNKFNKDFNLKFSWNISMLSGYKFFFSKKNIWNSWFLSFANLSKYLDKINCNYVLILGWNKVIYYQAIFYAVKKKIPILLRSENNLKFKQFFFKSFIKRIIFPFFFSLFNKIFYIGELNKCFYLFYGVKKNKLISAPYFVDNNFFYQKKKKYNKIFNILFVGTFINRKRPFDILKIAKTLENYKDIKFILIGSGPLLLSCKKLAKEHFLNNVDFKGFQNQQQIKKIYTQAHILINSSSYETWGLVVNEAMSAGLPCIVTSETGCAVDLIKNGKTGYTYKVKDLISLKKYILKIYNNKRLYFKMSFNSNNIIKEYNIKNTVNAISRSIYS